MLVCPESISGLSPYPVDVFQFFHTWSPPGLFLVFLTSSFRLVSIFMANLGMEVECILQTCPIHCHFLLLINWNRGMMLILLYSYSFEMAIDQKMRNILQRHRIWKVSILFELTLDTFFPRFGAPSTLRLNILILVSALIIVDLQVFRSTAYAAVVLEIWAS